MTGLIVHQDLPSVAGQLRQAVLEQGVECKVQAFAEVADAPRVAGAGVDLLFHVTDQFRAADLLALQGAGQACGAKAIVVAPAGSPLIVQQAMRAGADDFIDAQCDLGQEAQTVLQRLRSLGSADAGPGPLFTVLPTGDPSHANLMAVNLGAAIAHELGSCSLLDFQLRGGDLAIYMQVDAQHTLLDLLNQTQEIDQTMFDQALSHHASGVRLLAGPTLFGDLPQSPHDRCRKLVGLARGGGSPTIVCAEDVKHTEQIQTMADSQTVILTTGIHLAGLWRTKQHIEYLVRAGVSRDKLHVAAFGPLGADLAPQHELRRALGSVKVSRVPFDPTAVMTSINLGTPLVTESPQSKTSRAIVALAEQLLGKSSHATGNQPIWRRFPAAAAALLFSTWIANK